MSNLPGWYRQKANRLFWSTRIGAQILRNLGEKHETGVLRCPNGCDFDDLELGKEGESFSAVIGIPYQFIRCGSCSFNGDITSVVLANDRETAVSNWNNAVRTELKARLL